MTIELIPVIEIGYNNQGVTAPDKYPYWDNSEIWDDYHEECYQKAGFKDKLTPYLKGSSFYKLSDITDNNLTKLTIDHTQEMRDGKYKRPQDTCAFFGGYVLRVDGQDKYFPQCCGELSDIKYWENISNGKNSYHEEHPTPQIEFKGNNLVFDFSVDEFDEPFQPTPTELFLTIDRLQLKIAVEKAKTELQAFEQRLNKINEDEKLNINNIGGLLIWDNWNYE
ncbi:hypothetical protein P3875_02260 [Myroides sp. JBRI-B21084]|uniref:hypothetical protein n=1 Tax=Myroides sp. JBRI-B21084 TaxID=3119977 RepID=UPI0026E264A5|nr:hypothetical protein [Paenimyroides cloacae]WKW46899.1 hypothetical protein P3875_02260 [Paenimyroides cloacae]